MTVVPHLLISGLVDDPDSLYAAKVVPETYHAPWPGIPLELYMSQEGSWNTDGDPSISDNRRRRGNVKLSTGAAALLPGEQWPRFPQATMEAMDIQELTLDNMMPLNDVLFAASQSKLSCHCKTVAVVGPNADRFASYLRAEYGAWKVRQDAISAQVEMELANNSGMFSIRPNFYRRRLPQQEGQQQQQQQLKSSSRISEEELLQHAQKRRAEVLSGLRLLPKDLSKAARRLHDHQGPFDPNNINAFGNRIWDEDWVTLQPREAKDDRSEFSDAWIDCNVDPGHDGTIFRVFSSEDDLERFINSDIYGQYPRDRTETSSTDRICGAVVFENDPLSSSVPKYTVRTNVTVEGYRVEGGRGAARLGSIGRFLTKQGAEWQVDERLDELTIYNWYLSSGFLPLQNLVFRFIGQERPNANAGQGNYDLLGGEPKFLPMPLPGATFNMMDERMSEIITQPFTLTLQFAPGMAMIAYYLARERNSKQREIMRLLGLSDWPLVFSWAFLFFLLNLVICLVSSLIVGHYYVNYSDLSILFFVYLLFSTAINAFGMFVASIITSERIASVAAFGFFFLQTFTQFTATAFESPDRKMATCLLPAAGLSLTFDTYMTMDASGGGCKWDNLGHTIANFSVGRGMLMLFLGIIIWTLLYYYCDQVVPYHGVGVPRPAWFCFLPSYWREMLGLSLPDDIGAVAPDAEAGVEDSSKFEPETEAHLVKQVEENRCVVVEKLTKVFVNAKRERFTAVDNVSLKMYEGECYCLLGHNGAGKTTTMSMMIGVLPPTDGKISVVGHEIPLELRAIRKMMGFCPQQNVLFDELTVDEHLRFFGRLNGRSYPEIKQSSDDLLEAIQLTDKRRARAKQLSGGMKRKLSVVIAFLGKPHLVILDEPSSGMDPSARRGLWEMLRVRRKGHVLCITTHYMDEADELGDRIAIMARGKLACSGTSTFLKKVYGCGYMLSFVKTHDKAKVSILNLVKQHCGAIAEEMSDIGKELLIQVPFEGAKNFAELFAELDRTKNNLGVESYGVSVTRLEEVFLKVGHQENDSEKEARKAKTAELSDKDTAGASSKSEEQQEPAKQDNAERPRPQAGMVQQFIALLIRRFFYGIRDVKMFCLQLLVPNLCLLFFLLLVSATVTTNLPKMELTTENWNPDVEGTRVPLTVGVSAGLGPSGTAAARGAWQTSLPNVDSLRVFWDESVAASTQDWSAVPWGEEYPSRIQRLASDQQPQLKEEKGFLDVLTANSHQTEAKEYGAVFYPSIREVRQGSRIFMNNGTQVPEYFNECARMSPPRSGLNLNCLLTAEAPQGQSSAGVTVFTHLHSFHAQPITFNMHAEAVLKSRAGSGIQGLDVSNHPLPLSAYQMAEVSAGVGGFISTMLLCAYSFIPAGIISFIVMERETEIKQLLIISGMSQMSYWISNFCFDCIFSVVSMAGTMLVLSFYSDDLQGFMKEPGASATAVLLLSFGIAATSFAYFLSHLFSRAGSALVVTLIGCLVVGFIGVITILMLKLFGSGDIPRVANQLTWILRIIPSFALGNGIMQIGIYGEQAQVLNIGSFSGQISPSSMRCPPNAAGDWDCQFLVGDDVFMLLTMSVVYLGLAILVDIVREVPAVQGLLQRGAPPAPPAGADEEDEDVKTEAGRVDSLDPNTQIVCVNRIRKVYNRATHAVRGISFAASEGQVFGLLGVNGAGKTSTFKMLCGEYMPSAGSIHIQGLDVGKKVHAVRKLIGYCPQFDALADLLTVTEHLNLYNRMKGVPQSELKLQVDRQLAEMDLTSYVNSRAGQLSGGTKRKLSVAIATTAEPPMVFLDEPSAGMDPVARRFMWSVVQGIAERRKKSVVILTTHSMEEAEALCSRIAIQVDGRFRCLGSAQQIKTRYGQGLELNVRINSPAPGEVKDDTEKAEQEYLDAKRAEFETFMRDELSKASGARNTLMLLEKSGSSFRYQILPEALEGRFSALGELFRLLQENQAKYKLADFQISQTTLEQIFNRFAQLQGGGKKQKNTETEPASSGQQAKPEEAPKEEKQVQGEEPKGDTQVQAEESKAAAGTTERL